MSTPEPLRALIDALVRMNAQEIVAAATAMESSESSSGKLMREHADDLRRATALARTSCELWSEICEQGALDSAGYSALGLPTGVEATQTGAFRG